MNSHVLLNHFLEQSLQLVNPKTCLHYMEYAKYFTSSYTQDFTQKHMHNMLDGGSWLNLLTADYFGKNDPYSGEIVDGRWKDAVIPTLDDQFFIDHEVPTDYTFSQLKLPSGQILVAIPTISCHPMAYSGAHGTSIPILRLLDLTMLVR